MNLNEVENMYETMSIVTAFLLVTEQCSLRCKYCLSGDTDVLMGDFTNKKIKDVRVNDIVLGFDEYTNEKRNFYPVRVLKTFKRKSNTITINTTNHFINITPNHRILNPGRSWKKSGDYKVGQYIKGVDNNDFEIIDIKKNNDIIDVYNLETESKTYIANGICVHNCYEADKRRNKNMSKEVAQNSLDFLFENAKIAKRNRVSITFFGGEPTLVPDIIEYVIEYGLSKKKQTGIDFTVGMITNCVQISEELYSILERYKRDVKLNVQLSIDGPKHIQDMYRVKPDGTGSFDDIERNVPIYKELFKNDLGGLNVHGCLNKQSLPYLYESYKFFKDTWGLKEMWFIPVQEEDWTDEDVEIYRKESEKIFLDIQKDIIKTGNTRSLKGYSPLDRCLRKQTGNLGKTCGAGKDFATITADGEIYPCHQIYFHDEYKETKIGNVFDKKIDDDVRRLFLEYDGRDLSCDSSICDHDQCYRCIAVNYGRYGSILSQVRGKYCQMMRIDQEFQNKMREFLNENQGDKSWRC